MTGRCEKCGRVSKIRNFFQMDLCDTCFRIEASRADGVWPDEKDLKEQSLVRLRNVPNYRRNYAVSIISSRWKDMFTLLQNFSSDSRVEEFMQELDEEAGYSVKGLLNGELIEV